MLSTASRAPCPTSRSHRRCRCSGPCARFSASPAPNSVAASPPAAPARSKSTGKAVRSCVTAAGCGPRQAHRHDRSARQRGEPHALQTAWADAPGAAMRLLPERHADGGRGAAAQRIERPATPTSTPRSPTSAAAAPTSACAPRSMPRPARCGRGVAVRRHEAPSPAAQLVSSAPAAARRRLGALPPRAPARRRRLLAARGEVGLNGWIKIAAGRQRRARDAAQRDGPGRADGAGHARRRRARRAAGRCVSSNRRRSTRIYGNVSAMVANIRGFILSDDERERIARGEGAGSGRRQDRAGLGVNLTGGSSSVRRRLGRAAPGRRERAGELVGAASLTWESRAPTAGQGRCRLPRVGAFRAFGELAASPRRRRDGTVRAQEPERVALIGKPVSRNDLGGKVNGRPSSASTCACPACVYAADRHRPCSAAAPARRRRAAMKRCGRRARRPLRPRSTAGGRRLGRQLVARAAGAEAMKSSGSSDRPTRPSIRRHRAELDGPGAAQSGGGSSSARAATRQRRSKARRSGSSRSTGALSGPRDDGADQLRRAG